MGPGAIAPELPELMVCQDGTRVHTATDWARRRNEILATLLQVQYGELPPAPDGVHCEVLHAATVHRMDHARLLTCRVHTGSPAGFLLRLLVPAGAGPAPVILNGDGCWHYASDAVIAGILRRGYAFAQFNRVEVASDPPEPGRNTGGGSWRPGPPYAAIAAWAWAYHRAVDALHQIALVDARRIAIVGHSRGGKASLLAGAMVSRIMLTSANNSGAGGAGCWRGGNTGAETLADITRTFPHWFHPTLARFAGRESELPFDQHFLKALVAPRALLTTEARGDLWANPQGTWHTHVAARAAYRLLACEDAITVAYREGGHDHHPADWELLLNHCDVVMRAAAPLRALHHVWTLEP